MIFFFIILGKNLYSRHSFEKEEKKILHIQTIVT